jgi:glycosyltransferase involved in cell wall biosynthesis
MSKEEIDNWWRDINCYVMPSSGEGFSHTPREALMRGIPTIISNYSAHESLVKLGFVRYFSPIDMEGAYKAVLFNRNVGKHAIFSEEDLINEMEYVINNYSDTVNMSLIGRTYLIENESWEICSNKLMDSIYE